MSDAERRLQTLICYPTRYQDMTAQRLPGTGYSALAAALEKRSSPINQRSAADIASVCAR